MKRNKTSFPGIPRQSKTSSSENALTENVEILTGVRGSNRALLLSDLVSLDEMKRQSLIRNANGGNTGGLPVIPGGGIDRPHAPVNVQGTGGFTFIAITWDPATYKGHAYAEVFRSDTDDFSLAARVATEVTDIFSDSVNMGSKYYYWVRFVNKADMTGPLQGATGLYVETQQSAEQILGEIGGLIEKSHLGEFLTTEIEKLPDINSYIDQLKLDIPQILIDVPQLMLDVPPLKVSIPLINAALFDVDGVVEKTKQEALDAKSTSESVLANNEALALNLIDAALLSDINWGNNTLNLVELSASIEGVQAVINSNFYTMAEADTAIAAAATTIQTMIEENGTSLTGDIALTYYTKVTANEAIALADTALKSAIEDPLGASIGATLNDDYYTSVSTDEAISAAGLTLKSIIEDPDGSSVGANLFTNYYTKTLADEAIAASDLVLKAAIEDAEGNSLGATLHDGYFTKTDTNTAISTASTNLKADIENPDGDSVGATLFNYYETKVDNEQSVAKSIFELNSQFNLGFEGIIENALAGDIEADRQRVITANFISTQKTFADENQALAESLQFLESQFDESNASALKLTKTVATNIQSTALDLLRLTASVKGVSADLANSYYTSAKADEAIAEAKTQLKTIIEDVNGSSIGADVYNNYYTKTTTNEAISTADTALKTALEDPEGSSIGADLQLNYYTKTTTDEAISEATTQLKATIENPDGSSIGADLYNFYETKVNSEQSVARSIFQLKSTFEPALEGMIETALAGDIEAGRQRVISANFIATQKTLTDENHALAESLQFLESQFGESNASALRFSQTIATKDKAVAADLLKLSSSIGVLGADLNQNYYTKVTADESVALAVLELKSVIEDPNGSSVMADLQTNHYTKTTADEATAAANALLKAAIENPNGDSLGATLVTNHYTKTTADEATAAATTLLQSTIEDPNGNSIGADLVNNFYTKTTADSAISTASTDLQALIEDAEGNSIGASLKVLGETVASNNGDFTALWGVKTTVAEITASFGLVNDGVDPIFAIKGAKFAVITEQNPSVLTPVFSVVDNKTVMKKALIDEAHIQSLVTDDLLSNRFTVGSKLTTPSINYDPYTGVRSGNFSMDPSGNMVAKSAVLESVTIKDALGNVVMSSTGAIPSSNISGLGTLAGLSSLGYNSLTGLPTLGSLAALDSLDYNAVTGKPTLGALATLDGIEYNSITGLPTLGSLAALNSLGYNSLTGLPSLGSLAALNSLAYDNLTNRPTLGSLAALNSLGYNALTGRPALGVLAALDAISYDSVTGKPTLGPFAGLTKILSTNVTTYIESGAIGSAQIDQAYIDELFGNNATFSGEVYAEKITGDLVDGDVLSIASKSVEAGVGINVATFYVDKNPHFETWVVVDVDEVNNFNGSDFRLKGPSGEFIIFGRKLASIAKGTGKVKLEIIADFRAKNDGWDTSPLVVASKVFCQMVRKGSGFIS